MVEKGDNTYGGKYVVNPSGGLISKGHPLGATGKYYINPWAQPSHLKSSMHSSFIDSYTPSHGDCYFTLAIKFAFTMAILASRPIVIWKVKLWGPKFQMAENLIQQDKR